MDFEEYEKFKKFILHQSSIAEADRNTDLLEKVFKILDEKRSEKDSCPPTPRSYADVVTDKRLETELYSKLYYDVLTQDSCISDKAKSILDKIHLLLDNKLIPVFMSLGDLQNIAQKEYELWQLREFKKRIDDAIDEFNAMPSEVRHSKKLKRFANRIGLTSGVRKKKRDEVKIFLDYARLVNGVGCPKTNKAEAMETIRKKYAIEDNTGLQSLLKRVHAGFGKYMFRGILPE